jgi:cupin 2 domain-containing protein
MENLFNFPVPGPSEKEIFTAILDKKNIRIERIVSTGQISPEGEWYDQAEHEWVVLLQGKAKLLYSTGESFDLEPGSHLYLSPHCQHRVSYTSQEPPCIWLAVFWK